MSWLMFTTGSLTVEILPSWAPDWRIWSNDPYYLFLARQGRCHYRASLETKPRAIFDNNNRILTVQGLFFDKICAVSMFNASNLVDEPPITLSVVTRHDWAMWQREKPPLNAYGDRTSQALAFERTLFAGKVTDDMKYDSLRI